jgi:glycosyltransferase involved in cell wall biosynthesis
VKVLYVVTAYPRWPGDIITPWLTETIRRLGTVGIDVEVLAPAYRGSSDQVIDGVKVHRFRYAPARFETLTHDQTAPDRIRERPWYLALVPSYVAAGSAAAARVARRGGFDVVHAFWPLPHGLLGLAAKRAARIPLVCTFFGVELSWLDSQMGLMKPVARRIIGGSDAITVISSHTARAVRVLSPASRLEVIPFGAAMAVSPDAACTSGPAGGSFKLLFVGRLVERKGVHVLLDAIARLDHSLNLKVWVVGNGPMRDALESRCRALGLSDRVEFAGEVPGDELIRRYRACSAVVLPAVRDAKGDVEGLGVVLLEALAHGKPVIASESGGIVDIVRHEETGLLVPAGDATSLADAITRYIADPKLAGRLAERGREMVAREFGWPGIIERLTGLYRGLASGANRRPPSNEE